MRRFLPSIALAASLFACSELPEGGAAPPVGAASVAPGPAPSVAIAADRLEGTWVFGDKNEPGPGAVLGCQPNQSLILQRTASGYHGSVTTCAGPCLLLEQVDGALAAGQLSLKGTFKGNLDPVARDVAYLLRFDAATQHLVGTRNGQPFWAAPFVSGPAEQCQQRIY
jgi:hypothetical protein